MDLFHKLKRNIVNAFSPFFKKSDKDKIQIFEEVPLEYQKNALNAIKTDKFAILMEDDGENKEEENKEKNEEVNNNEVNKEEELFQQVLKKRYGCKIVRLCDSELSLKVELNHIIQYLNNENKTFFHLFIYTKNESNDYLFDMLSQINSYGFIWFINSCEFPSEISNKISKGKSKEIQKEIRKENHIFRYKYSFENEEMKIKSLIKKKSKNPFNWIIIHIKIQNLSLLLEILEAHRYRMSLYQLLHNDKTNVNSVIIQSNQKLDFKKVYFGF